MLSVPSAMGKILGDDVGHGDGDHVRQGEGDHRQAQLPVRKVRFGGITQVEETSTFAPFFMWAVQLFPDCRQIRPACPYSWEFLHR